MNLHGNLFVNLCVNLFKSQQKISEDIIYCSSSDLGYKNEIVLSRNTIVIQIFDTELSDIDPVLKFMSLQGKVSQLTCFNFAKMLLTLS